MAIGLLRPPRLFHTGPAGMEPLQLSPAASGRSSPSTRHESECRVVSTFGAEWAVAMAAAFPPTFCSALIPILNSQFPGPDPTPNPTPSPILSSLLHPPSCQLSLIHRGQYSGSQLIPTSDASTITMPVPAVAELLDFVLRLIDRVVSPETRQNVSQRVREFAAARPLLFVGSHWHAPVVSTWPKG